MTLPCSRTRPHKGPPLAGPGRPWPPLASPGGLLAAPGRVLAGPGRLLAASWQRPGRWDQAPKLLVLSLSRLTPSPNFFGTQFGLFNAEP